MTFASPCIICIRNLDGEGVPKPVGRMGLVDRSGVEGIWAEDGPEVGAAENTENECVGWDGMSISGVTEEEEEGSVESCRGVVSVKEGISSVKSSEVPGESDPTSRLKGKGPRDIARSFALGVFIAESGGCKGSECDCP